MHLSAAPASIGLNFRGDYMKGTLLSLALSVFVLSCSARDMARLFKNENLEKQGVRVELRQLPRGLYDKPMIIAFDQMLADISDGQVRIRAYNVYTSGNYDKLPGPAIPGVSNFLDPHSKYKDAWFGVYIILDDGERLGRRFMLKNPAGVPDDLSNVNEQSLLMIPRLDQKIIVWSSHEGQKDLPWASFSKQFIFKPVNGSAPRTDRITDPQGRNWVRITGSFETNAALTEVSRTDMGIFSSIRNYTGLPDKQVYELVAPWHPVVVSGRVMARYFACSPTPFWAVVYFNGAAFTTKQGVTVDNWNNTDLQREFDRAFDHLIVDCASR